MTDWRRVGLLVPSSDVVMESDLWRRLPPALVLHVARMFLETTTVSGEEKMLDEELAPAAQRLASVRPELAIFGCTSAAALRGMDGDATIARVVQEIAGCPCITVIQAAFDWIAEIEPQSLLLVTPYVEEINERMRATFCEAGMPVSSVVGMGLDDDLDIGAVPPQEIHRFVVAAAREMTPGPDCVFVSCTTFQSFAAAHGLERELGIPIVTSNRGVFRAIGRHFGQAYSE